MGVAGSRVGGDGILFRDDDDGIGIRRSSSVVAFKNLQGFKPPAAASLFVGVAGGVDPGTADSDPGTTLVSIRAPA